jgi:hypothetical protein
MDGKDTSAYWNTGIQEYSNTGNLEWYPEFRDTTPDGLYYCMSVFQRRFTFTHVLSQLFSLVATAYLSRLPLGDAAGRWQGISHL